MGNNMNTTTDTPQQEKTQIEESFDKVTSSISSLTAGVKEILADVKQLEKEYKKLKVTKKKKTNAVSQKNEEMNLTPLVVKPELCKFLSLKPNSEVTRKA